MCPVQCIPHESKNSREEREGARQTFTEGKRVARTNYVARGSPFSLLLLLLLLSCALSLMGVVRMRCLCGYLPLRLPETRYATFHTTLDPGAAYLEPARRENDKER